MKKVILLTTAVFLFASSIQATLKKNKPLSSYAALKGAKKATNKWAAKKSTKYNTVHKTWGAHKAWGVHKKVTATNMAVAMKPTTTTTSKAITKYAVAKKYTHNKWAVKKVNMWSAKKTYAAKAINIPNKSNIVAKPAGVTNATLVTTTNNWAAKKTALVKPAIAPKATTATPAMVATPTILNNYKTNSDQFKILKGFDRLSLFSPLQNVINSSITDGVTTKKMYSNDVVSLLGTPDHNEDKSYLKYNLKGSASRCSAIIGINKDNAVTYCKVLN